MTVSVILKCCGCLKSFSESLAFTSSPFPSVFLAYWAKVLVFGSVILVYPLVATVSPWLIFSCFKSVKHHFLREASLSCPRPHSPVRTWQHWAFFFIEHIPICLFSVFPLNSQLPENRSCVCFVPDCIPSAEQCLAGRGAPVCLCGRMPAGWHLFCVLLMWHLRRKGLNNADAKGYIPWMTSTTRSKKPKDKGYILFVCVLWVGFWGDIVGDKNYLWPRGWRGESNLWEVVPGTQALQRPYWRSNSCSSSS